MTDHPTAPLPEQAVTDAESAPDLARQWRAEADATWDRERLPAIGSYTDVTRCERAGVLRECADELEAAAPAIREPLEARIAQLEIRHAQADQLVREAERRRLVTCQTPCDESCGQPCHEVHKVASARDHDPRACVTALLREAVDAERQRLAAAMPSLAGEQASDHAPIESIYGTTCRTCVTWQDAPLAEGGETEFGIAVPQKWPCRAAELEQLARDILRCYLEVIGADRPDDVAEEIGTWEAILKGETP